MPDGCVGRENELVGDIIREQVCPEQKQALNNVHMSGNTTAVSVRELL